MALGLANSWSDAAQVRLLRLLALPVDYSRADIGARLDSGGASLLEVLALDTLPLAA